MRGRATEEGTVRFFRRFSETRFDQADIIAEAHAFAAAEQDDFHGAEGVRGTGVSAESPPT